MTHRDVDIEVGSLSRVEGEGALHVSVTDGEISDLRLRIYEPPRFFEGFLRGRGHHEPVDITARICGICPVAYQMSAASALERISGVTVDGALRDLRRLLYAGEWIESHMLHIGFLHAPDFLGAASGIELAAHQPARIEQILQLKKLGNDLMTVVGGRPIHPVNVRLGGFYRAPERDELMPFVERLAWAEEATADVVRWTVGFEFPDLVVDHELVSLRHPTEYAVLDGRVVSDRGLDVDVADYDDEFVEVHVAHSTALHGRRRTGEPYLTGPLARWTNNHDRLSEPVHALADEIGVGPTERNPFRSILVRGLEVLDAVITARALIDGYVRPAASALDVPPCAGTAWGASEAPRGVLFHRYETDADGTIVDARIVPPTAQNQPAIEADVRRVVEEHLRLHPGPADEAATAELQHRCEVAIRNHDPCISCATHFLRVDLDHAGSDAT